MKEKIFNCSCGAELLKIEKDEDGLIIISFYELADLNNTKHRFWNYLKRVVKTIFLRQICIAEIILDVDKKNELKKFIAEL